MYEQDQHYGPFAFWVGVNLLNNYFFFVGQVHLPGHLLCLQS